MKHLRPFYAMAAILLFAAVLSCTAGRIAARESAGQYVNLAFIALT